VGKGTSVKIVALSDTHTQHRQVTVPDGDLLVFAGDLMGSGRKFSEVVDFGNWFSNQPHKYKIFIAGNHDHFFQHSESTCLAQFQGVHYLHDSGVEIDGIKFWGSPYQPEFYNWAFNCQRGAEIKKHWDLIPEGTDVLITHGPQYGILDQAIPNGTESNWGSKIIIPPTEHCGCEDLSDAIKRVKPKIHIFGHIHGGYGSHGEWPDGLMITRPDTRSFNASICNEQYNPVNEPHVITLER
jgi:Icc-related predicted phosphoesterase